MFQPPPQPHQLPPPHHHQGAMNSQSPFYPIVQEQQPQQQPHHHPRYPQQQQQQQQQFQPIQVQQQYFQPQLPPQQHHQSLHGHHLYPQLHPQVQPQQLNPGPSIVQPQPANIVYGNVVAPATTVAHMNQHILQQEQEVEHQRLMKREEDASVLLFIIGFFCHWIWLIGHFKYRSSPSLRAQQFARYSRNAFIVSMILAVVFGLGYLFLLYSLRFTVGPPGHHSDRGDRHRNRQPPQYVNGDDMMIKSFIPKRRYTFDNASPQQQQFLKLFPEVKANADNRPVVVPYEGLAAEVKAMEELNSQQQPPQKQ